MIAISVTLGTWSHPQRWKLSRPDESVLRGRAGLDTLPAEFSPFVGSPIKRELKVLLHPSKEYGRRRQAQRRTNDEQLVRNLSSDLNGQLTLPVDIEVSLESCDDADAFYDPDRRQIIICDEMVEDLNRVLAHHIKPEAKLRDALASIVTSIYLHEVSHALIDVLNLPITGREEDAADQFSILMLLRGNDGERQALTVTDVYRYLARIERREDLVFWDEHSLDAQRYYDQLCLIYGHDTNRYAYFVEQGTLPGERAELCAADYQRIENSWKTLLKPYAKDSLWDRR